MGVIKFNNTFKSVIVVGDIHGDIIPLVFKINQQYNIENSLIIVAGDVGLGFHKDEFTLRLLQKANLRLKKKNNILMLLRGNHDKKDIWEDNIIFKKYWQDGNENIRLLKDYTVIEATSEKGKSNILCVGGALSIDRTQRTVDKNYWLNEVFVYDEDKVKDLEGITHVITHSCPDFCEPTTKGGIVQWMKIDSKLEEDCNRERADHTLLYNKLKEKNCILKYMYGHMHYSHFDYFDGTMFKLLDIMEIYEI